jgi:hypothetical protein
MYANDVETYITPTNEIHAISPTDVNIALAIGAQVLNMQPGNELTQVVTSPT